MRIDIVSIFPEYLQPLRLSLVGRAITEGSVDLRVHDLREYAHDRHRTVDDAPYGGGPGMLMKPEPWGESLDAILEQTPGESAPLLVMTTPAGRPFTQELAEQWSGRDHLIVACGRYEGIDARVAEHYAGRTDVVEVSIGDYVLAGGEAAALVMVEAIVRLLPGVLGNAASAVDDSFAVGHEGLLEAPGYTRPEEWRGLRVPSVLRSGDHAAVARWRRERSRERTQRVRPDLLA